MGHCRDVTVAHDGHPENSLQLGSEVCRTDVSRGIGEEVPWMNALCPESGRGTRLVELNSASHLE